MHLATFSLLAIPKRILPFRSKERRDEDFTSFIHFLQHSMPSQPDYDAAHRLNPDKFSKDPSSKLAEMIMIADYLADQLAAKTKTTRNEVLKDARAAIGEKPNSLPQVKQEAKKDDEQVVVTKEDAQFFAHKERSDYYPISMKESVPWKNMKAENVRYFATEEEAKEAGFLPKGN